MTVQLYIIPVVHLTGPPNYNVPKYLPHRLNPSLSGLEGVHWAWTTYLLEDVGLLIADVTTAQHNLLSGRPDVLSVPALDSTVPTTAVRNRIRTLLEGQNVPGGWVNTGMTYRAMLRVVLGMFHYHNRLTGIMQQRIFDGSINLNMTVSQIPAGMRDRLREAADTLGLDYSWVTGNTTIRALLQGMGDQFANRPFEIGGVVI